MGGEIGIKDKEPGETGTCFGFNVSLKISERQDQQVADIEQGTYTSSSKMSDSDIRALLFRETNCFKGGHCLLVVHEYETRRILHTWMESIGMKVWIIPRVDLISSTLERIHSTSVSPSRASLSHSGLDCETTDWCFSPKEMVNQVLPMALRNNNNMGGNSGGDHPFGALVILDVSNERLDDISREVASLGKIKNQAPCKLVCLADLKTSSEDFARLERSFDLVLRKPMHGSRLYRLLRTMRDIQVSPAQHPYQACPSNPGASQKYFHGIAIREQPDQTAGSAETACLPQEPKIQDDRLLDGMRVLMAEDNQVLQIIQERMLSQLGATVEVAGDGSRAVDMFIDALERAGVSEGHTVPLPYDLVFMDCQVRPDITLKH